MLTILTLLKTRPSPNGAQHGERPFWRELGEKYLDAWLANVERFVPGPKIVRVMTDSPELVRSAESVLLDSSVDAPGFWAKLNMFRSGVSMGKTLYCDLDNIIAGPLDELCAIEPFPLVMLDDRRCPLLPNGSLMLFDAERCRFLWERYAKMPREIERTYVANGEDYSKAYDQAYIAENVARVSHGAEPRFLQLLLPRGYILNARTELDTEAWKEARVIFGCGSTKPHTSTHPGFTLGR